jgi:hypothetical protein
VIFSDMLQHVIVALVALAAGVMLSRRLLGLGKRSAGTGCPSCPSGRSECGTASPAPRHEPVQHRMVLIRPHDQASRSSRVTSTH